MLLGLGGACLCGAACGALGGGNVPTGGDGDEARFLKGLLEESVSRLGDGCRSAGRKGRFC